VRSGRLTPEQAADHPHRSVITRALGTEANVAVDTFTIEAAAADVYLLCSDGLTTMVGDDEILGFAASAEHAPQEVADALVAAANQAGGEDNITVVVFEVVEGDPDTETETETETETDSATVEAPADDTPSKETQELPVSRRGAGKGGRWLAVLLLLAVVAAAVIVVWWSVYR
jgi:protein phosphatase